MNSAVTHFQVKRQHPAAGFQGDCWFANDAAVVDVSGDAADAVAAHLGLAAVGVEDPHPRVGFLRWTDQDQPVSPDAEMPIADRSAERRRIARRRSAEAIDVDIVVAAALHFGETHCTSLKNQPQMDTDEHI